MKKCKVTTGYGYYKDTKGHIVAKAELPKGEHPLKEGFSYLEVGSMEELSKIVVFVVPETEEEIREKKIKKEMRQLAIESLKVKGEIE